MGEYLNDGSEPPYLVRHRGHLVMTPGGWLLVEVANRNVPLVSICGENLMRNPDSGFDTCPKCGHIAKAIHQALCELPEDSECKAGPEPEPAPYNERARYYYAFRSGPSTTCVLMRRYCDEDGLSHRGTEVAWKDIASYNHRSDLEAVLPSLRMYS